MSERTAQCQECANVFECAPRGVLPKLCPDCKRGAASRVDDPPAKRNGRKKHANNGNGSPAIADAINALRDEIGPLEEQLRMRREALAALEGLSWA